MQTRTIKIWHISDTHGFHGELKCPEGIDMVIHSGDCSNHKSPYLNEAEVRDFLGWYSQLPVQHKVFVGGNHDTSIEQKLVRRAEFKELGITYLENEEVQIEGVRLWGTPVTPEFGVGWAWNRKRDRMNKLWQSIPEGVDIVISHGAPKGVLDLSYNRENELEFCGCSAMKKRMLKLQPKLCLFGHIHNSQDITNAGTMQVAGCQTLFSNATCVEDGKFSKGATSNGNVLTIETEIFLTNSETLTSI